MRDFASRILFWLPAGDKKPPNLGAYGLASMKLRGVTQLY